MQDQLGLAVRRGQADRAGGVRRLHAAAARVAGERDRDGRSSRSSTPRATCAADRWYKLGRTILYGALEDEASFQTVRRFVQYEDYTLRLHAGHGFPTPRPTASLRSPRARVPDRDGVFDDAVEISDAEVDDGIIDEGLRLIRKLWESVWPTGTSSRPT